MMLKATQFKDPKDILYWNVYSLGGSLILLQTTLQVFVLPLLLPQLPFHVIQLTLQQTLHCQHINTLTLVIRELGYYYYSSSGLRYATF